MVAYCGLEHARSLQVIERYLALDATGPIEQRGIAVWIAPHEAIQAGDGSAHTCQVDDRSISPLLRCQLVLAFDLARREHSRLRWLPRIGGKVRQLQDVRYPRDMVDGGFHNLDPHSALTIV